jgi:hypothetical protein
MFKTDRECIKEAARGLIDELDGNSHLRIDKSLVPGRLQEIDGWVTNVAGWNGNPSIAVSIDRIRGFETAKFWTGFWGNRKQIEALVGKLPPADRHDLEFGRQRFSMRRQEVPARETSTG